MTEIRGKPHTSPLDGTEAVPLSPDGYATTQEIADLAASGAGSPIVRKFPFAFDTPDLNTGAIIYTPTPGDVILDAWVDVDEAWDGTTPFGDVGTFVGYDAGYFAGFGGGLFPIDMTQAGGVFPGLGLRVQNNLADAALVGAIVDILVAVQYDPDNPGNLIISPSLTSLAGITQYWPAEIPDATPIRVCVSQTGRAGGDDPGSTQGAGAVYLVTATPVSA